MCEFKKKIDYQPLSMVSNDSNYQGALTHNHLLLLRGVSKQYASRNKVSILDIEMEARLALR